MAVDEPILFPPLPKMPEPPVVGPDPRQTVFLGIVGALSDATRGRVQATNTTTGFQASAPSLGAIKDAHELALTRFDMGVVQDRWEALRGHPLLRLLKWADRTFQQDRWEALRGHPLLRLLKWADRTFQRPICASLALTLPYRTLAEYQIVGRSCPG